MKKLFAIALAATTLFAACSKDGGEGPGSGPQVGGKSTLILKMAFPRTYAESAATAPGESDVNTVDVFIFNKADGSLVNHKPLTIADFSPSGNTYTANDGIETTAGEKLIAIGINLPATVVSNINTVKNATAAKTYVYDVTAAEIAAAAGFVMFSTEMADETLVADDDPAKLPTDNKIDVEIERLAAKGALATTAAYTTNVGNPTVIATVADLKYKMMQSNKKSFLMRNADRKDPNYVSSDYITSGTPTGSQYDKNVFENAVDYIEVGAGSSYAADYNDCPSFYGAENTSDFYQLATTTYFLVRAQVTPASIVNSSGVDQGAGTPGADFWMLTDGTTTHFTANAIDAGALSANNTIFPSGATVTPYTAGYCYYAVFVGNKDERAFLRNNFYVGQVKAINGIGKSTEEEVIVPPTAPVDGELATMDVEFKILNWTLNIADEVELD